MKKTIYIFVILIVAISFAVVFRYSTKENITQQTNIKTDQQIVPSGKLTAYHNNKYGYSVSYPEEMKITNSNDYSVSVFFADDAPSQGVNISATSTTKSISEFMAEMEGQPEFYTWAIEKPMTISGLSAVVAHQKTTEALPVNDFSSRSVFIKKNDIIFQFNMTGGGNNIFNTTRFIDSIKFDK